MSSVEGRDFFRNYYLDFLKHPEQIGKRKSEIIDSLTKTFDALGSLNKGAAKPFMIKEKTISISEMGSEELKIFAEFAKKFLKLRKDWKK